MIKTLLLLLMTECYSVTLLDLSYELRLIYMILNSDNIIIFTK